MKKITGFRKFTSKNGLNVCAVSVEEDFSENDKKNCTAIKGIKAQTIMIFGDDGDCIKDDSIGKELCGYFGFSKSGISVQNPSVK